MSTRRTFLSSLATAAGAATLFGRDYGPGAAPAGYPDPDIVALDPSFGKYIVGNTPIQRLHTGCLWAEGPAWNGVGNYLLWSDIPNNVQMRWLLEDGHVSTFRNPSNNSNGNTFDTHGRQISAEHLTRRVTRYESNGKVTVLADKFEGKPFNAPNDVVVHPDGGVWFTDPGYGSMGDYEGEKGPLELKPAVYRISTDGVVAKLTDLEERPNGLCFSPDYKKLYVVDTGKAANINVYDVIDGVKLGNGKEFAKMRNPAWRDDFDSDRKAVDALRHKYREDGTIDENEISNLEAKTNTYQKIAEMFGAANGGGGSDGARCDIDGNLWVSAGWSKFGYNGVHVFNQEGVRIGLIRLPETGSNLCFGGPKRNRLFITASQSLYSVYVNTRGAHWC